MSIKERSNIAEEVTRRHFLWIGVFTAGGTLALGGAGKFLIDRLFPPEENPYLGWEKFRDDYLPQEKVVAIGEDIRSSWELPGFPEAGELILLSQRESGRLADFLPQLQDHGPIKIRFTNLVETAGAIGAVAFNVRGVTVEAQVRNRATGETQEGVFVEANKMELVVELDNSFYRGPEIAKKLIMVKEFSHLLYIEEQKRVVTEEVARNFEIIEPKVDNLEAFLFINGHLKPGIRNMPSLGDSFDNALFDLDGAGYWHIMPAFGKMRSVGLLSERDLTVLKSDNQAFGEVRIKGLLQEVKTGEFVWKEGIGPFSREWRSVIRGIV